MTGANVFVPMNLLLFRLHAVCNCKVENIRQPWMKVIVTMVSLMVFHKLCHWSDNEKAFKCQLSRTQYFSDTCRHARMAMLANNALEKRRVKLVIAIRYPRAIYSVIYDSIVTHSLQKQCVTPPLKI